MYVVALCFVYVQDVLSFNTKESVWLAKQKILASLPTGTKVSQVIYLSNQSIFQRSLQVVPGSQKVSERRKFGNYLCNFLQAWCTSCHPTNGIKALKEDNEVIKTHLQMAVPYLVCRKYTITRIRQCVVIFHVQFRTVYGSFSLVFNCTKQFSKCIWKEDGSTNGKRFCW